MKQRRAWQQIAALGTVVALSTTAACSNGGEPAKGAADGGGQKVKLELLSNKSDVTDTLNKIIAKFHEQNPGIEIEVNAPPNMLKVLAMRIANNDAPPLFTVYPSAPSMRQPVKDGYYADLTGDAELFKNVVPSFVDFSKTLGKNYTVPYALEGYGVTYNVDMFKELGLSIPKTYAELIQVAEKIKAAGKTPFLFPDKDYAIIRQTSAAFLGLDIPDASQYFDDVINGKKHIADNQEVRKVAQKIVDLRKYGQKDLLGTSSDNVVRDMAAGKGAMFFHGMWQAVAIKKANPNMNVDIFPFPAEKAEDTKVAMQVGTALSIPKDGKYNNEAKKFMEFFATTEMAQMYADETGNISVIKDVKPNYKENKTLAEYALSGKLYRAADSAWTPAMQDDFGKATQELIGGGTIDDYMKRLEEIFYNKGN
ncbi:extracellular solute-binding protein [Paenibacillus doosanensis]|uniref:Multiple sugar-binding protein n=1 Tax=Paenibacillus konkukensis TaxID=2020716 RepID=A0ABY4RH06_9BACL|nr:MULTISPECIES: extracellular solute-binding protein [Paenibacillus]MCS7463992.1 extracellular solute-binding protein [Paenibacillus doosanensis]UQZ81413.1 Multiple sugar-binding protein precursor [Paenibacillus konkukensis]